MSARRLLVIATVLGGVAVAHAESEPGHELKTVPMQPQAHATVAGTLYLNRCVGGCTIHASAVDDARAHQSSVPKGAGPDYTLSEFAWSDDEWNAIVQCVKEVYSPYKVTVTDQLPAAGVAYNENLVGGLDTEVGWQGAGGVSPKGCAPQSYIMSYTFANEYGPNDRVFTLCQVVAQETGHAYGLDHAFEFVDGSSACRDPMTYRTDCGGQKFFRNESARCGEGTVRQCSCGDTTQNSHLALLAALGPGTPITTPPTVTVTTPTAGATIPQGQRVIATASAQRGIKTVELWLNGYLWGTASGVAFGANGQPEAPYSITIPDEVPDGVIDIVVKAKDDIDVTTVAATVTVTKGAACTTADTCLAGQRCDAGKCLWDPPAGELGDECTYPQYCLSGVCAETSDGQFCSQNCLPSVADSCPDGLTCVEATSTTGFCLAGGDSCDGGCCGCTIIDEQAAGEGTASALTVLFLGGVGFLVFRRRRR